MKILYSANVDEQKTTRKLVLFELEESQRDI